VLRICLGVLRNVTVLDGKNTADPVARAFWEPRL
jgi:hypothetical protein